MEEISKTRMILAIRNLERRVAKIEGVPCFRGIPVTAFEKEHLIMLCNLFANEWRKAQRQCFEVLDRDFIESISKTVRLSSSDIMAEADKLFPSIWRKIWNKIKGLA